MAARIVAKLSGPPAGRQLLLAGYYANHWDSFGLAATLCFSPECLKIFMADPASRSWAAGSHE
jgi:hypothetical protein